MTGRQLVHPKQQLQVKRENLERVTSQLKRNVTQKLKWQSSQLLQTQSRLQAPTKRIKRKSDSVSALSQRLQRAQANQLQRKTLAFSSLGDQLNLVSPLATLDRGFSIARDSNNKILRRAEQTQKDDQITVQLSDGELDCTVTEVKQS